MYANPSPPPSTKTMLFFVCISLMCLYYLGACNALREADRHGCEAVYDHHGCEADYNHHGCEADYNHHYNIEKIEAGAKINARRNQTGH